MTPIHFLLGREIEIFAGRVRFVVVVVILSIFISVVLVLVVTTTVPLRSFAFTFALNGEFWLGGAAPGFVFRPGRKRRRGCGYRDW